MCLVEKSISCVNPALFSGVSKQNTSKEGELVGAMLKST
jgi:hypothetical protein